MKLLVGPGLRDPRGDEAFLVTALKKAADIRTFDADSGDFQSVLKSLPYGWHPDAVLVRDAEFYRLPGGLERAECPVVGLIGDYNLSLNRMLPIMDMFDYFLCDSKGVRIFRRLGYRNCEFFCLYGYDPGFHRDYSMPKEYDIVFIGNLNYKVQQERLNYLHRLASLGRKFRVYIDQMIFGAEYVNILNRSHLVFNRSIRDEVNMRFFEAPACGAVVMNNHIGELDLLGFRPGQHYLPYEDSLEEAVTRYFEWPESRRVSLKEEMRCTLQGHSYEKRAYDMVEHLQEIEIDLPKRKSFASQRDMNQRWARYVSNQVHIPGMGWVNGSLHPIPVQWQRYLVDHELEIENLDFEMWFWWMDILEASGLKEYLCKFMTERLLVLESFGCYQEIQEKIRSKLNRQMYGFSMS
ncbi:MAG: glycosyltransferase [Pseudomonadota bacterium]